MSAPSHHQKILSRRKWNNSLILTSFSFWLEVGKIINERRDIEKRDKWDYVSGGWLGRGWDEGKLLANILRGSSCLKSNHVYSCHVNTPFTSILKTLPFPFELWSLVTSEWCVKRESRRMMWEEIGSEKLNEDFMQRGLWAEIQFNVSASWRRFSTTSRSSFRDLH